MNSRSTYDSKQVHEALHFPDEVVKHNLRNKELDYTNYVRENKAQVHRLDQEGIKKRAQVPPPPPPPFKLK